MSVTMEQWYAELEKLGVTTACEDAEGVTPKELAKQSGRTIDAIRRMLRNAIETGEWEFAGFKYVISISQKACPVPVYRPKR